MPLEKARRVEIGSRLRDARKGAKLSLADVAQEIKLSKQAVSAWESGRTTLDALQLGNLALLYGVSADFLLFGIKTIPEDLKAIYSKARNA
jgi:transcriptional regulator with XRE-family HTH domain